MKPGRNEISETAIRNATARRFDAVANASNAPRSFKMDVGASRAFMSRSEFGRTLVHDLQKWKPVLGQKDAQRRHSMDSKETAID